MLAPGIVEGPRAPVGLIDDGVREHHLLERYQAGVDDRQLRFEPVLDDPPPDA
jgi:hypothetical protein